VTSARQAAERALAAIEASPRPEAWISRFEPTDLLVAADRIDAQVRSAENLPLAGLTFAVKDNIDVAGLPTTAGCPAFSYRPVHDAPAVRALMQSGALCLGKTNMDQFATGLVGTRSPYGAVRSASDPDLIAGGSSSGSAVVVALGEVDLALGTDTAGSGRVPAALNGVVGFKATMGLVSTVGVVPACRSFDCVTVFARDVAGCEGAMAALTGPLGAAPGRRSFPPDLPLAPRTPSVIAVPDDQVLSVLGADWLDGYRAATAVLVETGCVLRPLDLGPFLRAGSLLYGGAFVAERYAAVGRFVDTHPQEVDAIVGRIIGTAAGIGAVELAADQEALARLAVEARAEWDRVDADTLLLPTTTRHPTLAEVAADPVGVNTGLGHFTTFLNLLDMCAVAVPSGVVAGQPFGVSCIGPAFTDLVQLEIAARLEGSTSPAPACSPLRSTLRLRPPALSLAVVGAHLSGQPLNHQLTERGARLRRSTRTAACYRLYALATEPPKPGLARVTGGGLPIDVEVWDLAPARFADFVASVPPPMSIGTVLLDDGTSVPGFLCEPVALEGAPDISEFGGWKTYLDLAATRSK
jgi:allophanate hydrolase